MPGARVVIVDIDVHHGNGTEACVRRLAADAMDGAAPAGATSVVAPTAPKTGAVLYCSTHLYEHFPHAPDDDFFPGRGAPERAGQECVIIK